MTTSDRTRRANAAMPIALAAGIALAAAACRRDLSPVIESTTSSGGKTAVIRVSRQDQQHFGTAYEITQRMMKRAAEQLDAHDPNSDIARLNRIGSDTRIQISHDTFRLLDLAQYYSDLSGGLYNFTVAPLSYLWGFEGGPVPTNVPAPEVIQATLLGVGAHNVALFDNTSAALTHTQTRISVDPISEAYAADMALVEARGKGLANVAIRIGQSMRAIGSPVPGAAWEWPLFYPFDTNVVIGRVSLNSGGMSIAMLRQRTVTIEGKTYGHIIDPLTGAPAGGTAMAVATGPSATKSAALAQALIVAGVEGAQNVIAKFSKYEALIIPDRQPAEFWMTPGFAPRVKLDTALQGAAHYFAAGQPAPAVKDGAAADATSAPAISPSPSAK